MHPTSKNDRSRINASEFAMSVVFELTFSGRKRFLLGADLFKYEILYMLMILNHFSVEWSYFSNNNKT